MKLIIFIKIILYIFCSIENYNNILKYHQCSFNSYLKKYKIENEIDINNIISIINSKHLKIYHQKNCIVKLPVAKKSDDIFAFLTEKERIFFSLILKKSKIYLEFGMGGSTLLAYMTPNIEKIISIDSDKNWINKIRNFKNVKKDEGKRIILEHIYIGKTTYWGLPIGKKNKKFFPNYSNQIFKKYKNDYDLVLIDSIFRVACALQVILNCKSDIKILIHDFNYTPYYHILYKYLDVIYSIDSLVLFSIKEDIDYDEVRKDYEIYKYK